jgi:hypothetical protein
MVQRPGGSHYAKIPTPLRCERFVGKHLSDLYRESNLRAAAGVPEHVGEAPSAQQLHDDERELQSAMLGPAEFTATFLPITALVAAKTEPMPPLPIR